jgi:hypothetical protein
MAADPVTPADIPQPKPRAETTKSRSTSSRGGSDPSSSPKPKKKAASRSKGKQVAPNPLFDLSGNQPSVQYERQVAMQFALAEGILILREFGAGKAPSGRQFLGVGVAFGFISVFEVFGDKVKRVGSLLGWLVVIGLAYGAWHKNPGILSPIPQIGSGQAPLFPPRQT